MSHRPSPTIAAARSLTQPTGRHQGIGLRVAELFRHTELSPEQRTIRACNLEEILAAKDIPVWESDLPPTAYTACLLRAPNGECGILLAPGLDRGRRRFALAHELGHYGIPTHQGCGAGALCADADMRMRSGDARVREWEANEFAAAILMPRRMFCEDTAHKAIDFQTVADVAAPTMYDVSLMAAAWRLIETTREPCALFVSAISQADRTRGIIQWRVASTAWRERRYPLEERQCRLPVDSAAAAVLRGEEASRVSSPVPPYSWLASADGRGYMPRGVEVRESTYLIRSLGQILSLVWVLGEDRGTRWTI